MHIIHMPCCYYVDKKETYLFLTHPRSIHPAAVHDFVRVNYNTLLDDNKTWFKTSF